MGRHEKWRSEVKKLRRKRIRQNIARKRDEIFTAEQRRKEMSPHYQEMLAEQTLLETFQQEEEARQSLIQHQLWLKNEELAQQRFIERQKKQELARQEKLQQDKLIREEWETEQCKLKAIEEEAQQKLEEKRLREELLMKQIDDFIKKGGELPPAVNVSTETHPDKEPCPFFSKTGACRFGDRCSRNHSRPGISKVLLIPQFYSHFGMDQSMADEYDTDLMLEYEDSETYHHFKEFYDDVLPEFETYGDVIQFKVCCNGEPHLRGNVYVEFSNERYAVKAYQKFHGRFYGGRQLNVEFTCVKSWKAALCGLFFKRRCPKGRNCNFLHVFRNPGNAFYQADLDKPYLKRSSRHGGCSTSRSHSQTPPSRSRSHRRRDGPSNWRWSESPEPPATQTKRTNGRQGDSSPRRSQTKRWEVSSSKHRDKSRAEPKHRRSSERSSRSNGSSRRSGHSTDTHRKEKRSKRRSRSRSKER